MEDEHQPRKEALQSIAGRVMGIDPSTYTGLACLESDGTLVGVKLINFPKERGLKRVQSIARAVKSIIREWKPEYIVIEGYAYSNVNTLVTLVEIGTMIRLEAYGLELPVIEVPPTVLKKQTTGKGNAKKAEMATHVFNRWGFENKSDDIIDAYALASLGVDLLFPLSGNLPDLPKGVRYAI